MWGQPCGPRRLAKSFAPCYLCMSPFALGHREDVVEGLLKGALDVEVQPPRLVVLNVPEDIRSVSWAAEAVQKAQRRVPQVLLHDLAQVVVSKEFPPVALEMALRVFSWPRRVVVRVCLKGIQPCLVRFLTQVALQRRPGLP